MMSDFEICVIFWIITFVLIVYLETRKKTGCFGGSPPGKTRRPHIYRNATEVRTVYALGFFTHYIFHMYAHDSILHRTMICNHFTLMKMLSLLVTNY